ncbi:hypothetical protein N7E81_13195 [Reichenbachiella carrageenanivorans]|uniref:Uncharacterized protein n=1 Tax=Reichenbachiella carrageenanivorans TaxID=2979869 RepID=A0ABY6CWL7_9BACT|nr:hypothetical protein [Reichenbachiella carrageenanivorans]UXX78312.1 hypothetical protein N7E81_13195 [Reichenbachiella carrageenanivorans]
MKQLTSILLAAAMLFGSMGFSMGTHFCGGEAMMDVLVLGHEHMDCGMGDMDQTCEADSHTLTIKKAPCCENVYWSLQLEEVYAHDIAAVSVQPMIAAVLLYDWSTSPWQEVELLKFFVPYTPPPLRRVLRVLYQTFRL